MRPRHLATALFALACDRDAASTTDGAARMAVRAESSAASAVEPPARPIPRLRFEDYAVGDTALGRRRVAVVDLASAPYGGMYRTRLREGATAEPNFAGHFTLVLWGCGTGCQVVAVVDARTGRLSSQTLLTANGVESRRDSRLVLADPRNPETPRDCASCGTPAYYEWRGGRFRPVGPGPHPHLGGPRPWSRECTPGDTSLVARTGPYTCPET